MNREQFIAQLARLLQDLPPAERQEAIRYYQEYFDDAGEENEDAVIQELGSPGKVAASIKANLQYGGSTFGANDTDMENTVISQEWHKELHRILFEALADIPDEQCSLIVRHYFNGRTFRQLAEEYHTTPQTLYNWKEAAFRSIRTGKYGKALAEFSSSESGKRRADSLIKQDLNALKRLELSNKEKELLAL